MTASLLVIGLDAAEASLIEAWADQGYLPNLRAVIARSAAHTVGNPMRSLPGAIWPELVSGVSCGKTAQYYHPAQLHSGEAVRRPITASEVDAESYYWTRAARAGLSVAAIDMPQTVVCPVAGPVQLLEWGLHDRHLGEGAAPDSFGAHVRTKYGTHPITSCDAHGEDPQGYRTLLEGLKRGAATKSALLEDALRSAHFDLFTAAFSECHCVGHQFWHFQDPTHPWYGRDSEPEFETAIRDVYQLIDAGVGRMIAAAGENSDVVVVASHGMGLYTGGPYLLKETLARLGMSSSRDTPLSRYARALQLSQNPLAGAVRAVVRNTLGTQRLRKAQAGVGALRQPLTDPRTRAVDLPNNRCGAVRLNLKGREPFGSVGPGNEEIAMIEDIRAAVSELRDPKTGEPLVEETLTAREAFGPHHHRDVPDLMVVFRDDLGILNEAVSPRLGHIHAPVYRRDLPRSGDHTTQSRIWLSGPRVSQPHAVASGNVLDLAPTVLDLLGLAPAPDMDGRSLLRA